MHRAIRQTIENNLNFENCLLRTALRLVHVTVLFVKSIRSGLKYDCYAGIYYYFSINTYYY